MRLTLQHFLSSSVCLLAALLLTLASGSRTAQAQEASGASGPRPLTLIDFNSPGAGKQVALAEGVPAGSTVSVDKTGIAVNFTAFQTGDADHPGFHVTPGTGKAWDLSACGHVEVKVTNTCDRDIKFVMHVVPAGEGYTAGSNQEYLQIQPGETKVVKVIFGYSHGYKPVQPLNSASISEIFIFLYHSIKPHSFRIEEIKAAGVAGETPVADATPRP